jgi:hypothetical protein
LLKISVLSRRLVCLMAADNAPRRGAEDAVMTGKVPGSAADQGTFNAAFGVCRAVMLTAASVIAANPMVLFIGSSWSLKAQCSAAIYVPTDSPMCRFAG